MSESSVADTPSRTRLPGPPSIARSRRDRRKGAVPGLRYRPAAPADPAKVAEVDRRLEAWAERLDLFPREWKGQFAGFGMGRAIVLAYPGGAGPEHLTAAGKLLLAENLVDNLYCEVDEGKGGSPRGLGGRLVMAQSALDPLHSTPEMEERWGSGVRADGPLRSYHHALRDYAVLATPSQTDRLVHDLARLHLGYLGEAAWAETGHMPQVWEYLVMRQFNNFRPCLAVVDAVDGWELPEAVHARPEVQRITALAGNAATIVNDLYSFTKEMSNDPDHLNLPMVIAANERCGLKAAYLEAVEIHNRIMGAFEEESAALSATSPLIERYATGLAAWVAGNHEWHATNTDRYSLPDYW
ncbi:family 2 encapsulin nanocompartment cargo protein terpene cyclase [Streptomyces europaeiscabiei]|uniref:family 2 encapsulin nanocompartment cargo protein terpene cyclase n=1 Tax=Streptomyces europaeiscabiei TaxID=146819 RepID=UPI0029B7BEFF|nr:family 2 encapsulin nanocompartment cargo protein terpene cyclase [Streptomyces europaeiscabiei]MDX3582366.1 family 2 encapsulin nanocompartment cargo protein terpene cyclase [Streptomyces europaeiscabiei]MDX3614345.1 family 2 encapsulin nanocompartment cargo protein terpene cyclase [Streptomyces europaeiscabiei]MDX3630569.1 family 2 encapsulin nanocompartment cargo protein terpene cyclase [Streptomyces europaeiscabiei]MDX3648706.1 family 2 encapsulin nanocompartment cargo protein terpene cy